MSLGVRLESSVEMCIGTGLDTYMISRLDVQVDVGKGHTYWT